MISRKVLVALMQAGNDVTEDINTTVQQFGLSIQQFNVLRILRGRKGEAASLECVTNEMIHRMSNTSRLVDRLIEKRLVTRKTCENNRRKVEIFITKNGLTMLEEIEPVLEAIEKKLTKNLSETEKKQLFELITKFKTKN
ncbi:MAG: MarR family transcriptional regulator [Flavobacteriaceae bacterium]|nr:MarR family transcriptional regulator [Flavobacteriaceae bacterium]